jgi:hypothetical protein
MIMHKPIKVLSCCTNIVSHNLFESFIIRNYEQVYHNHIAKFEFVYHIWHTHITEGIENYESCLWILLDVIFN